MKPSTPHTAGSPPPVRTITASGRNTDLSASSRATLLFFYRQGECGRRIVAHGIIRSHPTPGKHWAKKGKTANYVYIDWDEVVPVDLAFDVDDLKKAVPGFAWKNVYESGRRVPDRDGDKWRRPGAATSDSPRHVHRLSA